MQLSSCDTLTGWSLDTNGVGTKEIDNSVHVEGSGCIKYTRPVSKARNNISYKRFTVDPTDFSNKVIKFNYRFENAPQNQLKIRLVNSSGPLIFATNVDRDAENDVWHEASITVPGSYDTATFVELYDDGDRFDGYLEGQLVVLYLDDLRLEDAPAFDGLISNCDSLNGWTLDTNGVGVGSLDKTDKVSGQSSIRYTRVIDKSRDFLSQLQVMLPRDIDPTGKALQFSYKWNVSRSKLNTRFITVSGQAAGSAIIGSNSTADVWETVQVPLSGEMLREGLKSLQFTTDGDRYTDWNDGETIILHLDEIRIVPITIPPADVVISAADSFQGWSVDTNSIGTKEIDQEVKNSDGGAIKHTRAVNKFRAGDVAASGTVVHEGQQPQDGETITIADVTYTFKLAFSDPQAANEVLISGSNDTTLRSLQSALNGTDGEGDVYSTGTVVNPKVSGSHFEEGVLYLTARTVGTAGNVYPISTTTEAFILSGSTLKGGGIGVRQVDSTLRLQLQYPVLHSRMLCFDYRWSLPNNELKCRMIDHEGKIVRSTSLPISENVEPETWHTARIPMWGAKLNSLKYLDIFHNGDKFEGWNDGDVPELWIDNVRMEGIPRRHRKRPAVVIQFDDGYKDNLTIALPIMQKYDQIATIGISTAYTLTGQMFGNNQPTLNVSDIQQLAAAGWEICSHSVNHKNLRNSDLATVQYEMEQSKLDLESWGFDVEHLIYPYTQTKPESVELARNLYSSSSIGGPPNQVPRVDDITTIYGKIDPQLLPRVAMGAASTLEDFQRNVLDSIANDTLAIIYFHALTPAPGTVHVLPEVFESMMRWLKYTGVRTLTTTGALKEFGYIE